MKVYVLLFDNKGEPLNLAYYSAESPPASIMVPLIDGCLSFYEDEWEGEGESEEFYLHRVLVEYPVLLAVYTPGTGMVPDAAIPYSREVMSDLLIRHAEEEDTFEEIPLPRPLADEIGDYLQDT